MIVLLLALIVALWFLLQTSSVQNYLADRAAQYISKELDTKVTVGKLKVDFFNHVLLDDLYVEDQNGDSLIYAKRLDVSIKLFSVLGKELIINTINLESPTFNLHKNVDGQMNLAFVLAYFSKKPDKKVTPSKTDTKPFVLRADVVNLNHPYFHFKDARAGMELWVKLEQAYFQVKNMDLAKTTIDLKKVKLIKPEVRIEQRGWQGPPGDPNYVPPYLLPEIPWKLSMEQGTLVDGSFKMDDLRSVKDPNKDLDFKHLNVSGIHFNLSDFVMNGLSWKGFFSDLKAQEKGGFVLEELQGDVVLNQQQLSIGQLYARTANSEIRDSFALSFGSFRDFKKFNELVFITANLDESSINLKDIMTIAPGLKNNAFFKQYKDKSLSVSGKVKGYINALKGTELDLGIGDDFVLKGSFSLKEITKKGNEFMILECNQLRTNALALRALLPTINFPKSFDRLGRIQFNGQFAGYLRGAFTATGKMQSSLGNVASSVTMNLKGGPEKTSYDGEMSIENFDLGKYLQDNRFGLTSMTAKVNGVGLTAQKLNAQLDATIQSFTFKDYAYQNAVIQGKFIQKSFEGVASFKDANADLLFQGLVDFNAKIPEFNFTADINRLDFRAINLVDINYGFIGKIKTNFKGNKLDNIFGTASVKDFFVIKNKDAYFLDSLSVASTFDSTKIFARSLSLKSSILQASIIGNYEPSEFVEVLIQFAERNYASFADKLGIESKKVGLDTVTAGGLAMLVPIPRAVRDQEIKLSLSILNPGTLTELLDPKFKTINSTTVDAYFNSATSQFDLDGQVGYFEYGNFKLNNFVFDGLIEGKTLNINTTCSQVNIGNTQFPINLVSTKIARDTLTVDVNVGAPAKQVSDLMFGARLFFEEDGFTQFQLYPKGTSKSFSIYGLDWTVSDDNRIRFKKDKLIVENLRLNADGQFIEIQSIGDKGVSLHLSKLDIPWLTGFAKRWDPRFKLGGNITATVKLMDVFTQTGLGIDIEVPDLKIAGDDWGKLNISANSNRLGDRIILKQLLLNAKDRGLVTASGWYNPPKLPGKESKEIPNTFEINAEVKDVSPLILEYLLRPNAYQFVGETDGTVRVWGKPGDIHIKGGAVMRSGAATIAFLNTRFYFDRVVCNIDDRGFTFNGMESERTFKDVEGNRGIVEYNSIITFKQFKDFGLDVTLKTLGSTDGTNMDDPNNKMLVINTSKGDNSVFYGKAYASGTVNFKGPFRDMKMNIAATTRPGTAIDLPLSASSSAEAVSFIRFVNKKTQVKPKEEISLFGMSLDMDLRMTPDAQVRLLFDEQAGDIISGRGNGDMTFRYASATSDFQMYGNYVIEQGDYLFTYQNFVNKPFSVKQGGTIKWTGDPYEAELAIEATYQNLKASPGDLIYDLLQQENDDVKQQAKTTTSVNLGMILTGALSHPDIEFSIDMPVLTGRLKSLIDSRFRELRQDKNELNRQVFGLIVLKRFLPPASSAGGGTNITNVGFNTISEMISSQLSLYLSDLLQAFVSDIDFISDINVNLNFQLVDNLDDDLNQTGQSSGTLNFGVSPSFLDGRLQVRLGGNVDMGTNNSISNPSNSQAPIGADFLIEYKIRPDGRFRIRAYNRTENNFTERVNRTGVGVNYRKEFDTFAELFDFMNKKKKKVKQPD